MRPCQRAFGIGRVGGRNTADKDTRQKIADAPADGGVVAILGDEDEYRDEAVELVDSCQGADAWALRELQDIEREAVQRLDIDLEKLVTRIGIQHVHQRTARVAGLIEAAHPRDLRHLQAQVGHACGSACVGAGGEQADNAQLAIEPAIGGEELDADIVEMDTAVHSALDVRLGDDQRLWLVEKGPDFRCRRHQITATAQDHHLRVAQDAKAAATDLIRRCIGCREAIFAHAEEGEVIGADPVEKTHGFHHFLIGKWRRVVAIGLHRRGQPGAHLRPVIDSDGNVGIDPAQPGAQPGARVLVGQPVDVDVDHAFALRAFRCPGGGIPCNPCQRAIGVARSRHDRVCHEVGLDALIGKL